MTPQEMKRRTRRFAMDAIRFADALPRNRTTDILARQLIRSATSVGANYRSACRARSDAEFMSKLGIVEEEADETLCWMELLEDTGLTDIDNSRVLKREANELLSIVVSSIKTMRAKRRIKPHSKKSDP